GILKAANDDYRTNAIKSILNRCKQYPELYKANIGAVLEYTSKNNKGFTRKFLTQKEMYENASLCENIGKILERITKEPKIESLMDDILQEYYARPELKNIKIGEILAEITPENKNFVAKYFPNSKLNTNSTLRSNIGKILKNYSLGKKDEFEKIIDTYLSRPELKDVSLGKLLYSINKENYEFIQAFMNDPVLYKNGLINIRLDYILKNYNKDLLDIDGLKKIIEQTDNDTIKKLTENINELFTLSKVVDLHGITSLNQLSFTQKRKLLRNLMSANTQLFDVSKLINKADFPLIPASKDDYCKLLPALVKSIGIETKKLSSEELSKFNVALRDLSKTLSKISDEDFNDIKISQEYSRDCFIAKALDIVRDLDPKEKQKVFDYFGFELQENSVSPNGYTIIGYPINLNNGAKLAEIIDDKTKQTIEILRKEVINFSERNQIIVNNPKLQDLLNEIIKQVPELRTMICKSQHKTHQFDLMQHTLKVMAKIVQNPEFERLNESDKKVTLLASIFHDITKNEGKISPLHGSESAFDSFYIAKKFNLTQEEEIRLNTLIKHHEWLARANKAKTQELQRQELQSIAYDFQDENLFKMAKIFTEADLKAVKRDDSYYHKYKKDFETLSKKIEDLIQNLRTTQPLLPVTKIPSADIISKKITHINPDMSTNIKGLYKTKDGLVIIKFNEVTDWEALGFPKGTCSRGIKTFSEVDKTKINTGNIKFIVHGLDESDQLARFNAFILPDSDALLSVSYAERPESKYRFFRTQGIILDANTSHIHGGGNTDAGSGCKKTIDTFKNNYIFGGQREEDRRYISDLIKKALNMSDDEYIEFVHKNKNKSMLEIEPKETREKLIKAMAQINSSKRKGNRSYNEMYVSNPKIMGVFAYSSADKVGEISSFMEEENIAFLKRYALENNMPFIIFGD
ncbi:MAG: hypothetical protein IKL52_04055, partial [Candidatus Gastranaerophilales bacterium]|nr:hypothetical protein [Candidatus Gastranaerophilales bacterium]